MRKRINDQMINENACGLPELTSGLQWNIIVSEWNEVGISYPSVDNLKLYFTFLFNKIVCLF